METSDAFAKRGEREGRLAFCKHGETGVLAESEKQFSLHAAIVMQHATLVSIVVSDLLNVEREATKASEKGTFAKLLFLKFVQTASKQFIS